MRILLCTTDNLGFVFPTIGLAKELSMRGHEVHVVGGCRTAPTVREHGFQVHVPVLEEDPSFLIQGWGMPAIVSRQAKIVDRAIEACAPDVLVTQQLALGPLLSSERYEVPVVVMGGASYLWPTSDADLDAMSKQEAERHVYRFDGMTKSINAARSRYGLPTATHSYQHNGLLGHTYMLRTVPGLLAERPQLPGRVAPVGACLWEPPPSRPDSVKWVQERAEEEAVIYVQFNRTVPHDTIWPSIVQALEQKSVSVITERVPEEVRPELEPLGDRVRIEPFVSSGAVLPHVSGIITTGHTTTVVSGLSHGIPLMLMPHGSGSEDIAARCVAAGAAVSVEVRGMTQAVVNEQVAHLLEDPTLREAAGEIQEEFRAYPGFREAARLVEQQGDGNYDTVSSSAPDAQTNVAA